MIIAPPVIPSLTSALQILSAMITPAVLILACGSLVMTTSSRLIRCVDRVRTLTAELDVLAAAGVGLFVATSVAIGVLALLDFNIAWVLLLLGFIGAGLLFSASVMLIVESRIALALTYAEMDFVLKKHKRG